MEIGAVKNWAEIVGISFTTTESALGRNYIKWDALLIENIGFIKEKFCCVNKTRVSFQSNLTLVFLKFCFYQIQFNIYRYTFFNINSYKTKI